MKDKIVYLPERKERPVKPIDSDESDENKSEPKRPDVNRPDTQELLKRMRRVDKDQSRRYRQRTGE